MGKSVLLLCLIVLIVVLYLSRFVRYSKMQHTFLLKMPYKNGYWTDSGIFVGNLLTDRNYLVKVSGNSTVKYTSEKVSGNPISGKCSNGLGSEDPRPFTLNGVDYVLYCDNFVEDGDVVLRLFVSPLENMDSRVMLRLDNTPLSRCEKNWTPWVIGDRLYISYFLLPRHRVYEIDLRTGTGYQVSDTTDESFPKLFGGTNAIPFQGKMVGVAHIKSFSPFLKYLSVFYEFSAQFPYEMLRVSEPFCFEYIPWCEFVISLRYDENTKQFLVSYGKNDTESRLVSVDPGSIKWLES